MKVCCRTMPMIQISSHTLSQQRHYSIPTMQHAMPTPCHRMLIIMLTPLAQFQVLWIGHPPKSASHQDTRRSDKNAMSLRSTSSSHKRILIPANLSNGGWGDKPNSQHYIALHGTY